MRVPITVSIDVECKMFLENNKQIMPSHILNDEIIKLMEAKE